MADAFEAGFWLSMADACSGIRVSKAAVADTKTLFRVFISFSLVFLIWI